MCSSDLGIKISAVAAATDLGNTLIANNVLNPFSLSASYLTTALTYTGDANFDGNTPNPAPGAVSVTPPASTVAYTAGPYTETIYLSGGTVSDVQTRVGGYTSTTYLSTGLTTPCSITLPPSGGLKITYTVAPTMIVDAHG